MSGCRMPWSTSSSVAVGVFMVMLVTCGLSPGFLVQASIVGRCDRTEDSSLPMRSWSGGRPGCHAVLSSVSAHVEIMSVIAEAEVNHTYINDLHYAIESATLMFSVPGGSVLLELSVDVAGRKLQGQVRSRRGAEESATCQRSSQSFSLYDLALPGSQSFNLGRIKPGDVVRVHFSYAQELSVKLNATKEASLRFALPLPPGARKQSQQQQPQQQQQQQQQHGTRETQIGSSPHFPTWVALQIINSSELLHAPSATVSTPMSSSELKFEVQTRERQLSAKLHSHVLQDIVFDVGFGISPTSGGEPHSDVVVQQHPKTGLLAAMLALPATCVSQPASNTEFVLILDRSASMRGVRLERVRHATHTFIRSIPTGVRLNLVGFGSDEDPTRILFSSSSRELNAETFAETIKHVSETVHEDIWSYRGFKAGASTVPGVGRYLDAAFNKLSREEGTQLRIFLLTDRHPVDTDEAISLVTTHCPKDCRLSALGIGWGASPPFVEGLAKAGRGTASFVAERGGAAALERTLVLQLVEALQPVVQDVKVNWDAVVKPTQENQPSQLMQPEGAAKELNSPGEEDRKLETFVEHGGIRDVLNIPVRPPPFPAGGRVLALAFLGNVTQDSMFQPALFAEALVGGKPLSIKLHVRQAVKGRALHALCANRLVQELSHGKIDSNIFGGVGNLDWQRRALGIAYSLTTAETYWALVQDVADAGSADKIDAGFNVQDEQCAVEPRTNGPLPKMPTYEVPAPGGTPDGVSNVFREPGNKASDASRNELSLRRPSQHTGAVDPISSKSTRHSAGASLSLLDMFSLSSSLAMRKLPSNTVMKPQRTGMGQVFTGTTLALRSFSRSGGTRSMLEFVNLGASLALAGGFGRESRRPWWHADQDWPDSSFRGLDFDPHEPGDSMGSGGAGRAAGAAQRLSTRNAARVGATLSIAGSTLSTKSAGRLLSQLSATDSVELSSSLAIRRPPPPSWMQSYKSSGRHSQRRGMLSMLDYMVLGSSLSLGGYGLSRKSYAGNLDRYDFYDTHPFPPESYPAGDKERPYIQAQASSLSLRSFHKLSSTIRAYDGASTADNHGERISSPQSSAVWPRLSTLDFTCLGASLSLRPLDRSMRQRDVMDLTKMASSLSVQSYTDASWPSMPHGLMWDESLQDDQLFGDSFGSDFASLSEELRGQKSTGMLGPRGWSYDAEFSDPFGRRFAYESGKSSPSSAVQGPSLWVGVAVEGSLLAPLLAVWRTGTSCQAGSETAHIVWPKAPLDQLKPASIYIGQEPLLPNNARGADIAELLGELNPPKASHQEPSQSAPQKVLQIFLQVSHQCDIAVKIPGTASNKETMFQKALPDIRFAGHPTNAASKLQEALMLRRNVLSSAHIACNDSISGVPLDASRVSLEAKQAPRREDVDRPEYYLLVAAQRFDGSFFLGKGSVSLVTSLGLNSKYIAALASAWACGGAPCAGDGVDAAHTAVALAVLSFRYKDLQENWQMLASKAEAWLAGVPAAAAGCGSTQDCIAAADLAVARWMAPPITSH